MPPPFPSLSSSPSVLGDCSIPVIPFLSPLGDARILRYTPGVDGSARSIVDRIEGLGYVVEVQIQGDGVCAGAVAIGCPHLSPLHVVKINGHGRRAELRALCELACMIGITCDRE